MSEVAKKFQLLHVMVNLQTGQDDLAPMLDFSAQNANQGLAVKSAITLTVDASDDGYKIKQDKTNIHVNRDNWDLAYALLAAIHREALRDFPDHIRIHAACADYQDSRFIVVGCKGAGKTTLMLKLLQRQKGFQVCGDEMVLIKNGMTLPFPRRFHIKTGYEKLFDNLRTVVEASPKFETAPARWLYAFSPNDAGYEWNIGYKPLKAIYYLVPNHGSETVSKPCSRLEILRRIMPNTFLSSSQDQLKIPQMCALINECQSYQLHLGNLAEAADIIRDQLS